MNETELTGTIIQRNGKRLLCQTNDGKIFITTSKSEDGIHVTTSSYWPMPSAMFGMACLAENDIDKAIEDMYMHHPREWNW